MKKPTTDAVTLYRIAAEASCDPRTAKRYLEGAAVRPMIASRLAAALNLLGYASPHRSRKGGQSQAA
jgi:hypothetical protein